MIEKIYRLERANMLAGTVVNPLNVELCAVLERALNYLHSGNTKVIATTTMNPLWIGQALLQDGLPCVNPMMVRFYSTSWDLSAENFPSHRRTSLPYSAAQCVIAYNYDATVYNVSTELTNSVTFEVLLADDPFQSDMWLN
jgi:hypothetical protein